MAISFRATGYSSDFRRPVSQDLRLDLNGNLETVSGGQEVIQRIISNLLYEKGEDIFDTEFGVDYNELFQIQTRNRELFLSILRSHIVAVDGVQDAVLEDAVVDTDTRSLKVSATVTTDYGQIQLSL